jgi:UDP:flavonoid glycosyltransferase YjiC (YdhE family)
LFFEWCSGKDELFSLASAVLIRGGHGTIAQAILRGKPMVLLPIPHHTEQIGNAAKVAALGAGISLDGVGVASSDLDEAICRVLEEAGFRGAVSGLRELALRYDGVKGVVNRVLGQLGHEPRGSLATRPVSA